MKRWLCGIVGVAGLVLPAGPVGNGEAGHQVRAGVFEEIRQMDLPAVLQPFVVSAIVLGGIYLAFPNREESQAEMDEDDI